MRTQKKLFIIFCCTMILFSNLFMRYTITVFAKPTLDEDGHLHVYNWDDIKDCAVDWVMYMASLAGAIFADRDFAKYVQNKDSWVNYWTEDNVTISENGTSVTFSKDLMAFIKQCIDDYAKEEQSKEENGGFILLPTTNISDVPANHFKNSQMFRTFRNIVIEKGCLGVATNFYGKLSFIDLFSDPDHPILLVVTNLSSLNAYKNNPDSPVLCNFFCADEWVLHKSAIMQFPEDDKIYTGCSGAGHNINAGNKGYTDCSYMNIKEGNSSNFCFYSVTGERIRVFVSRLAAQNYSVGNRKVYFTENYYNYVPEDLSVSIDDLQKTVDDLQKVIDQLLGQIGDNASEKEIEELLKKILEAIQNQPGGGGGIGGGDVNVDIDLSGTNTLLSKILAKVTQIFEKMDAAVEDAGSAAMTKIQESLDEIIVQLKKIKHWTIADTVIDAADAVADWADLILGILKDAEEGAGSAVAAIAGTVGDSVDMMAQKFPFSVPWDILLFVSLLSAEPQMPYFEIPFNVELSMLDITIDYTMKLDFSQLQWLSDLSRLLLSMTYAVGLLKMTAGITSVGKE